ncbi:MAG: M14 family zinc carboxypeptidase [Sarcina sp.]
MKKGIKILVGCVVLIVVVGGVYGGTKYYLNKKSNVPEKETNVHLAQGTNVDKTNETSQVSKPTQSKNQTDTASTSKQVTNQPNYIKSILPVEENGRAYKLKHNILQVKSEASVYQSNNSNNKIGEVGTGERVVYMSTDGDFTKVEYSTPSSCKEGYIQNKYLEEAPIIPNNFNNLVVPKNVTKVQYGTSGEGRPLYYYKIGNGDKHILMNFAIHGYEDSWAQDGYALTQMAEYLIKNLSEEDAKQGNLNGWTFYIIPSANPDGLLDGYTNCGPGRAQISQKIDLNRDFSGPGFIPSSDPRNRTEEDPLTAPEAKALAKLVDQLASQSNGKLIVTDTHGWLDFTKGNEQVASYFDQQFGLQNQVIHQAYYGGYLVGYAKKKGAKEVLIELPDPKVPANIEKDHYNQKMLNAVNNLINNYKF